MVLKHSKNWNVADLRVLAALARVPRHAFVSGDYQDQADADWPLPIGYGQTISQPYVVAVMTALLELRCGDKVLEIGTGSGYQSAVLAEIVGPGHVYTAEIIAALAEQAAARLATLGYGAVHVLHADGYFGWEADAPYNAIIVTAAPDRVPSPLLPQLAEGGRLVIPIGAPGRVQTLWRFTRTGNETQAEQIMDVAFVPLTRAKP